MKDTHTSVVRATQAVQPAGTTIFIVQVRRLAEVIFWDTVYMDAATRIARLHVFWAHTKPPTHRSAVATP